MLTFPMLKQWLVSLGADPEIIFEGPYVPDMPDRAIIISLLSGAGYTMEGALDNPTFQVRVRATGMKQRAAETLAYQLDQSFFLAPLPVRIGDTSIQLVDRVGGTPSPLGPPDPGDRVEYVCSYRVVVSYLPIASVTP